MNPHISKTMRLTVASAAHLWISDRYLETSNLPSNGVVFFIYDRDLEWGRELLQGKRVRVSFSIEKDDAKE